MSSVRIIADLPIGEADISRTYWEPSMIDTGRDGLAEALAEAANAVLRSYGVGEQLVVVTESAAALQRLRKADLDTVGELYRKGKQVGD